MATDKENPSRINVEALANSVLTEVLKLFARRFQEDLVGNESETDMQLLLKQLKLELGALRSALDELIEKFIADGSVELRPQPERPLLQKPPQTLLYGAFTANIRLPGIKSGATIGRVGGLAWEDVELGATEIPEVLASAIADIQPGKLLRVARTNLHFCQNGVLWHLWFPPNDLHPGQDADAFAIVVTPPMESPTLQMLDWTNEPIYQLNEQRLFRFSRAPRDYIRCFFHLVRGQLGRFVILENPTDLDERAPWLADAEEKTIAEEKARAAPYIQSLERMSGTAAGELVFRASMLFRNAIFHSDVVISANGSVRLENEALKCEELPVYIIEADEPEASPPENAG